MFIMAIFRRTLPIEAAYVSRYLVYTHILYAIICTFLFLKITQNWFQIALFTFSSFFYILNYNAGIICFDGILSTLKNTDYYYPAKVVAKHNADEACRLGIYCIEKHRFDK